MSSRGKWKFVLILVLATCFAEAARPDPEPAADPKPVWPGKDTKQWPQILLSHDLHFKDDRQIKGASGFLMKLPNGAVVAASATHILGDDADLASLDTSFKSWSMAPRTMPQRRAALKKLALTPDESKLLDCLVMTVTPVRPWPVEVLVARARPVEKGEVVYLIAVPNDDKAAQHVYPGTVARIFDDKPEFGYIFEAEVQTQGFSGAPVIDADGQVVGIHHGKFDDQPGGGKIYAAANAISEVLKVINVPAPVTAEAPKTDAPPATPVAAADDDLAKAAKELGMAKNYVALKKYDVARPKLAKIVEAYPKTPAAKEAKKVLEEIEGK